MVAPFPVQCDAPLSHDHHIAQVDKYLMLWYLGEMHETRCDGSGSQ